MENKKQEMKTSIRIIGEINIETLKMFLDETDVVIDAFEAYKRESFYVNSAYLQPFPSITIEISSYGGCTDCGSAILHRMDEMKNMGISVNTHCHFAYSMAFIIYINGMKRTAERFSKWMNHGSASFNRGYVTEQKSSIIFSEKSDEQFEQLIYENTKMSKERVERARTCYDWIAYEEAVELGIVNYGYEGCEPDWDELDKKYAQAVDLALQTFCQMMEIDDELDGLQLLEMGLSDILEQYVKKDEKVDEQQQEEEKEWTDEEIEALLEALQGNDVAEVEEHQCNGCCEGCSCHKEEVDECDNCECECENPHECPYKNLEDMCCKKFISECDNCTIICEDPESCPFIDKDVCCKTYFKEDK